MKKVGFAAVVGLFFAAARLAADEDAEIIKVDADKKVIEYKLFRNIDGKRIEGKAIVANNCVIRKGHYFQGKPGKLVEREVIPDGLKNPVFQKASAKMPLAVNIFLANDDDETTGIKRGDVIKILVN